MNFTILKGILYIPILIGDWKKEEYNLRIRTEKIFISKNDPTKGHLPDGRPISLQDGRWVYEVDTMVNEL